MPENDRVLDCYHGRVSSAETQAACRDRIHWLCRRASGQHVLDVGCSQGITCILLAREGSHVVGVDTNEAAITVARQALGDEPPQVRDRVRLEVSDALAMSFEPSSFDTIILGEILEHLTRPSHLLRHLSACLAEEGRILVSVPLGYHPHHDHKRTFYLAGFLELLGEHFDVQEIAVVNDRYLCSQAVKPLGGQPRCPPDPVRLQAWQTRCDTSLAALQARRHREYATTKDKLDSRLSALQAKHQTANEQARALRSKNSSLQTSLRSAHDSLKHVGRDARSRVDDLQSRLQSTERRQRTQNVRPRETVASQRAMIHELNEELAALRATAQELGKSLDARDRELSNRDQTIETLRTKEGEQRSTAAELKKQRTARQLAEGRSTKLRHSLQNVEQILKCRENEVRYRLGCALVNSYDAIRDTLILPYRVVRLFSEGVSRRRARKESEQGEPGARPPAPPTNADVPTAETTAQPPAVLNATERIARTLHAAARDGAEDQGNTQPGGNGTAKRLPAIARTANSADPRSLMGRSSRNDLRVACILDEFSYECFSPETSLFQLTKPAWREELAAVEPDFLFVESAWRGVNGEWRHLVEHSRREGDGPLRDIVHYCKRKGIPTVFWNKEDPVNFRHFCETAKWFDFIFTTDEGSVGRYQDLTGHDRCFVLPFAAQPHIHNPLDRRGGELGRVFFAGTWYAHKHDGRRTAAEHVLVPALEFGLHIYDRMHHYDGPGAQNYQWPDAFRSAIRGGLSYLDTIKACRGYHVCLNVNSVQDSRTMCARRVFEIAGCATALVSGYSPAVDDFFPGGSVFLCETASDTQRHLRRLLEDERFRNRAVVRALRHVMAEHTYAHRFSQILSVLGREQVVQDTSVVCLMPVRSLREVEEGERFLAAQSCSAVDPLWLVPTTELAERVHGRAACSLNGRPLANSIDQSLECTKADLVFSWMPGTPMSGNWMEDLVQAFTYSDCEVIGKPDDLEPDELVFREVKRLPVRSSLVTTEAARRLGGSAFTCQTAFEERCRAEGLRMLATDTVGLDTTDDHTRAAASRLC